MPGTNTYRLLRGRKRINGEWVEAGDTVKLTEAQALNLRLSIEPVHTAEEVAVEEPDTGYPQSQFHTTLADSDVDLWDDEEDLDDETDELEEE